MGLINLVKQLLLLVGIAQFFQQAKPLFNILRLFTDFFLKLKIASN